MIKPHSFPFRPRGRLAKGRQVGEQSFSCELSQELGRNTSRIHGALYRLTFSADNEEEASSLMESLPMVLRSYKDRVTVIYFIEIQSM